MADTRNKKTFLVGLRLFLKAIQTYVKKYAPKIKENAGDGVYAVIELILGLVEIVLSIMETNSDILGNYQEPISTLNSQQLNEIAGAIAKFNTSVDAG